MGRDSIGAGQPDHHDGPTGKDKICLNCAKVFQAHGPGNHKYCSADCKKANKGSPSASQQQSNKRGNAVLSPQGTDPKSLKEDDLLSRSIVLLAATLIPSSLLIKQPC
jgi:hypothetical protein